MLTYQQLPLHIKHHINLFLINKGDLLNNKTSWCHHCGEIISSHLVCGSNKCNLCCKLHCLDKTNYYLTPSKAPPFNEEELCELLDHYKLYF